MRHLDHTPLLITKLCYNAQFWSFPSCVWWSQLFDSLNRGCPLPTPVEQRLQRDSAGL